MFRAFATLLYDFRVDGRRLGFRVESMTAIGCELKCNSIRPETQP